MELKKGDKVAVLDDVLEGYVIRAEAGTVYIETTDGFEMEFAEEELVKIETPIEALSEDVDFEKVLAEKKLPPKPKSRRIKPKERNLPPMEVDLHIEKLTRSSRGMSNYDILNLQMETAKRQLEFAISKRIQKIVFIHGVGEAC